MKQIQESPFIEKDFHFNTKDEALAFLKGYLDEYNPRGYGTQAGISFSATHERWTVTVTRWRSCD